MVRSVDTGLLAVLMGNRFRACLVVAGSHRTELDAGLDLDMMLGRAGSRQLRVDRTGQAAADRTVLAVVGHSTEVLEALRRSLAAVAADSILGGDLADSLGRTTGLANRSLKALESHTVEKDIDRKGQT